MPVAFVFILRPLRVSLLIALFLAGSLSLFSGSSQADALSLRATTPQPRVTDGCRYGDGGPNHQTICWIDMSTYDEELAGAEGQQRTVTVGDYKVEFVVKKAKSRLRDWKPLLPQLELPISPDSSFGNSAYRFELSEDDSFAPVLYQQLNDDVGETGYVEITDITVKSLISSMDIRSSFSIVMADADVLVEDELLRFESDVKVDVFKTLNGNNGQACPGGIQEGKKDLYWLDCAGAERNSGSQSGALLAIARDPNTARIAFSNNLDPESSRLGVAFGIMFSEVQAGKVIEGDRATVDDQFLVSATDSESAVVASAQTRGSENAAQSVPHILGPELADRTVVFSESAANGSTDVSKYRRSWTCTRNGDSIPEDEISAGGADPSLVLASGDFVSCTASNTALQVESPSASPVGPPPGTTLPDTGIDLPLTPLLWGGSAVALGFALLAVHRLRTVYRQRRSPQ